MGELSLIHIYAIIPHLSVPTEVSGLVDLPKPSFVLDIPPLMSVMSALVTALLLGLAVSWTKAEIINKALAELEAIMTSVVTRVIIPILPFFVGATFCELSYEGRLTCLLYTSTCSSGWRPCSPPHSLRTP